MKYFKITISIIITIAVAYFAFIIMPSRETGITPACQDSMNILKKQLQDCDSSNAEYFYDDLTDVQTMGSLYDSIGDLNLQIKLLNAQIELLKKKKTTSDDACVYWENKFYQCNDKLSNQIK